MNFLSTSNDYSDVVLVFDGPRCNGPTHENQIERTEPEDEKIAIIHGSSITGDRCDTDYEPIA